MNKLPPLSLKEMMYMKDGDRISAIKSYRSRTGCGLKDAKRAVESGKADLRRLLSPLNDKEANELKRSWDQAAKAVAEAEVEAEVDDMYHPRHPQRAPLRTVRPSHECLECVEYRRTIALIAEEYPPARYIGEDDDEYPSRPDLDKVGLMIDRLRAGAGDVIGDHVDSGAPLARDTAIAIPMSVEDWNLLRSTLMWLTGAN